MNKELDLLRHWKTNVEYGVVYIPEFVVDKLEQALIKAQEQEKILNIILKYQINIGEFYHLVIVCKNSYKTCKEENRFVGSCIASKNPKRLFPTEEEFNSIKEMLENEITR